MAFELRRESPVPSLGAVFQEYVDPASGAKHIHLKSDSNENCFMVSFPTVPHEDDGRAHILEHLSLCGSQKYPTRDPFFSMTRRSLATFMNAMTYPDRTVYPFASQDRKDYFNLLDVYLDAAFFPNLDRLDFLQEGWRHSLDEKGQLTYNGVVFNEMKQPMADPGRALWHGLQSALKPGTTYAFESGGDPLSIPQLSHEELIAFHKTHYHPSRATFWSFGDIDPALIQERIQQAVIEKTPDTLPRITPDSAPLPRANQSIQIGLPSHGDQAEFGYHVAWHIGEIGEDYDQINRWQIFDHAISGDSASPLTMALENAGFGRPSGVIGTDAGSRQATFHIGMEGLSESDLPKAKAIIESTLAEIARDGIPLSRLQSVVRDFELSSLEIRGGSTPHGLRNLLGMAALELNGGDPLRAIDTAADLEQARKDIEDPEFIKSMARQLLASEAKVEAHAVPDAEYSARRDAEEAANLASALAKMTPRDLAEIRKDNEDLLARQRAKPDVSSLPKIHPNEIARDPSATLPVEFTAKSSAPSQAFVEAATNGVGYFSVAIDASRLSPEDWPWLSLGSRLAMELGFGSFNYEQAELFRSEHGSGFGVSIEAGNAAKGSGNGMALRLRYSAKSMEREAQSMAKALCANMKSHRFDEHERIAFLIQSSYQETLQNVAQAGAGLASNASTANVSALGAFSAATGGMNGLAAMTELDALSKTPEGLQEIQQRIEATFAKLADAPTLITYIGSRESAQIAFDQSASDLAGRPGMPSLTHQERSLAQFDKADTEPNIALQGPGQLNYCYATWPGPTSSDPDCGPMMVLGALLRNTFLHRALREEGGAYGGSSSHSSSMGSFTMSSYRDPRLSGTYDDFSKAIEAAVSGPIDQDDLDEAIVSIMQGLDKPGTPKDKASGSIARAMAGIEFEDRQRLRASILDCSIDDLRRVAQTHLLGKTPHCAAYVCPKSSQEAVDRGMDCRQVLPSTPSKGPKP